MSGVGEELEQGMRVRRLCPTPILDRHHADAKNGADSDQALNAG